ncbi:MAG: hypothetical protein O2799_09665 [Planctomycetota bacterium]|nr:hypothetical protein [Planctomycetota bacterium]
MKLQVLSLLPLLAAPSAASDLDLRLQAAGGATTVTASPGEALTYEVLGELTDANHQGLAFFAFDLAFDGGALVQADAPTSAAMLNFATPLGLNNPAGFGGTPSQGALLQVGGAQNTINQTFAAAPSGMVMTGVAAQGSPVLLASGPVTAPQQAGTYQLVLSNPHANVIAAGAVPNPFWRVERAGIAGTSNLTLTIEVVDCTAPVPYCVGKANSLGCVATLSATGTASLTGADDFRLQATNVVNKQFGLYFWGLGESSLPWQGGTLCVQGPLRRMITHFSGGAGQAGTACTGVLDQLFPQTVMANNGLQPGDQVFLQAWYRDPQHPDGTGVAMTDALRVTICP